MGASDVLTRRRLLAALIVVGSLAGGVFLEIGNLLAHASSPIPQPDAIIALGSHEWERLPVAARLARGNPRAVVMLTTPVRVTNKNCYRCDTRADWLVRNGVARPRIVMLTYRVRNTHDEAAAAFSYAATRGIRSVMVVTSPYHGRRALATFRTMFEGTPVRVGLETALNESGAQPQRWWTSAYDRWYVAYESAAIVMYAFRYGVNPFGR